jgi:hypothetical protein
MSLDRRYLGKILEFGLGGSGFSVSIPVPPPDLGRFGPVALCGVNFKTTDADQLALRLAMFSAVRDAFVHDLPIYALIRCEGAGYNNPNGPGTIGIQVFEDTFTAPDGTPLNAGNTMYFWELLDFAVRRE